MNDSAHLLRLTQQSIENASINILWLSKSGNIIYANSTLCNLLGYTKEEILSINVTQIIPDFVSKTLIFTKKVDPRQLTMRFESILICKNGWQIPIELMGNHLTIQNDEYIFCYLQDITERRLAEIQLSKSESQFRTITELFPMPIAITAEDIVEYVNPEFLSTFGFTAEEIPTIQAALKRGIPDEKKRNEAQEVWDTHTGSGIPVIRNPPVFHMINKNGLMKAIAFRLVPMENQRYLVILEDITEKQTAENEKLRAQRIESIALLAGGIAHDFNNILVGIMGNTGLLQINGILDQDSKEIVSEIEKAAIRAKDLTRQLLTFSKGGAPVKFPHNISQLLSESINFVKRGSNCTIEFTYEPGLPFVDVDAGQINQVFNNILINAMQAMPDGGIIKVSAERLTAMEFYKEAIDPAKFIKVKIIDHGKGISKANQDKIFQPYFSTKSHGNGLGLATCYSIIKRHGGHITFESMEGKGTCFVVFLPIAPSPVITPEISFKSDNTFVGRVLIMDDEPIIQKTYKRMLESLGFVVTVTNRGEAAIDAYQNAMREGVPYRLVIMDLTIPGGMGGKDAIVALKTIDPKIKAIVSSGYADDPIVANYQNYGFVAALNKPFKIEELKAKIAKIFNE